MGQNGFKNLLEQVQSVAPDINTRGSTRVDESSIQYNSDDESQVHEILQQSNRLMEHRETGDRSVLENMTPGTFNEEERMKQL